MRTTADVLPALCCSAALIVVQAKVDAEKAASATRESGATPAQTSSTQIIVLKYWLNFHIQFQIRPSPLTPASKSGWLAS